MTCVAAVVKPRPIPVGEDPLRSDERSHGSRAEGGAYLLAKIRFASSSVSFDPMSYQSPGTSQV
jgi:hypothetical protein